MRLCSDQHDDGRRCIIPATKNEDDGTNEDDAPEQVHADPVHADSTVDGDEAWEGFVLDARVFRSGRRHQKD